MGLPLRFLREAAETGKGVVEELKPARAERLAAARAVAPAEPEVPAREALRRDVRRLARGEFAVGAGGEDCLPRVCRDVPEVKIGADVEVARIDRAVVLDDEVFVAGAAELAERGASEEDLRDDGVEVPYRHGVRVRCDPLVEEPHEEAPPFLA